MLKTAASIAFVNIKGGTGKTTTCINVAGYLAKSSSEKKVLVVDFDPQANATSGLGIDGSSLEYSIYDALLDRCEGYSGVPITQIILETDVENLHLAPSELHLGTLPMVMQQVKDRVGLLRRILEPVLGFYDYILIDAPSDAGLFMLNSLRAADRLVVPLDSSIFSLEALENLKIYCADLEEMTGHPIGQFTIVLNRYSKSKHTSNKSSKSSPSEEVEATLKQMHEHIFTIPESLLIYRSQQEGIPLSHLAPTSKIAKDYQAIANHLALVRGK
ncbi:MAG: ParA family protein [Hormoscilla sp.]